MQEKNSEESTENFLEEDFQEKLEKSDADLDEKVEADLQDSKSEEEPSIEEVFNWFDRDGSGSVDQIEFAFGCGWIFGYYMMEPTEEDAAELH